MKLKDNSTQEIDTALYQLEQRLKSNIRLTDVENSNASTAKINAVDKKLTEEVKDRQSADGKLQDNINKEIADRQEADAAIENAKQDKLIAGNNIQIDGNIISATSTEYTAEAPVKVTDGKISLDTVPVNKGGTGVTTQADINKAFIGNLTVGNDNVTDGTEFVSSWASDNGFAEPSAINKPYKRQFVKVWNYIKDKISSVLGLTKDNYGGKASTAGNADTVDNYHASQLWRSDGATWNPNANVSLNAAANGDEWSFDIRRNGHTGCYWHVWDSSLSSLLKVNADDGKVSAPYGFVGNLSGKASTAGTADVANALAGRGGITNTDTFQNVMNNDGKWYVPDLNSGWSGSFYSFHGGGSQSGLMFRIRGGSSDIRNIEVNYSIDSNRFAGPWTPLIGRIPTSAPSSPQDGDIWIER